MSLRPGTTSLNLSWVPCLRLVWFCGLRPDQRTRRLGIITFPRGSGSGGFLMEVWLVRLLALALVLSVLFILSVRFVLSGCPVWFRQVIVAVHF